MTKQKTEVQKTQLTKLKVAKALAPYTVLLVLVAVAAGVMAGWFMRSDFDNTIRTEVVNQYSELTKAPKEVK